MIRRWLFADQLGPHFLDAPRQPVLLVESKAVFRRRAFHRQKAHLVLSALRHRAAELGDQAIFLRTETYGEALRKVSGEPLDVCHPTSRRAHDFVQSARRADGPATARLHHRPGRVRRLGRRPARPPADGGLLPRRPPPPGRPDGRRRTGRRQVEPGHREPPATAGRRHRGAGPTDAGRGRDRRRRTRGPGPLGTRRHPLRRRRTARGCSRRPAPRRWPGCGTSSTHRLPAFGPYEDAMLADDPWMAHSLLSAPLNLGLIDPLDAVHRAEAAYRSGAGAAVQRGGLRPAADRLARLHLAPLLVLRRRLPRRRRPARDPPGPVVVPGPGRRRTSRPAACPTSWPACATAAGCTTSPA